MAADISNYQSLKNYVDRREFTDYRENFHFNNSELCLLIKEYAIIRANNHGYRYTHTCCEGKGLCFKRIPLINRVYTDEEFTDDEEILNETVQEVVNTIVGNTEIGTEITDEIDCPICYTKKTDNRQLNCSHVFCKDCITRWFECENTCPLCRSVN